MFLLERENCFGCSGADEAELNLNESFVSKPQEKLQTLRLIQLLVFICPK